MFNRPFNTVLARLGLVAAILATLMILAPAATAATSVEYAENDTAPVATFSATDDDGDAIVWSLDGDDKDDFTIDGGVLAFKDSPNYEKPTSSITTGTLAEKNVYNVTVQANGGTEAVTVTVTNVDEAGSVSFGGDGRFQPQVDRGLSASLSDPDMGETDERWQWARSMDMATWTDIEGATSSSRMPVEADADHYLRASVTYTDSFGTGKTASAVTGNKVETKTLANAAPSFSGQDDNDPQDTTTTPAGIQINRSVAENAAVGSSIGEAVSASDADNDVLVYTLSGTDAAKFDIDSGSGQIKVKTKLNFEAGAGDADNCVADDACVVIITATDPSGATNPDDGDAATTPAGQPVKIAITNVNEAAVFDRDTATAGVQAPRTTLYVVENDTNKQLRTAMGGADTDNLDAAEYNVTDEDTDDTAEAYRLEGADATKFSITEDAGVLTVAAAHDPNYEKQNSYSITIVAESGTGDRLLRSRLDVTVKVEDADDAGMITLSQREPQVGRVVVATLSDPDGGVVVSSWQWYSQPEESDGTCAAGTDANYTNTIANATSATYTPKATDTDDADDCLQAVVIYRDNLSEAGDTGNRTVRMASERGVQAEDPANTAPKFPDQDPNTSGDQSDSTSRTVMENTDAGTAIGPPVEANDEDLLLHTLGGPDGDMFSIDRTNGQISTKEKLDYEALPEGAKYHMVTVTATDPSGATDSIMVTINVTDENDNAVISTGPAVNTAPAFAEGETADRMVYENMPMGTDVGAPVTATDEDAGQTLTYSLNGGGGNFEIDSATGQITTTGSLDYEVAQSYTVTVTADDGQDENSTDTIEVTVTVGDVNPGCTVEGEHALTNDCETLLAVKNDLRGSGNLDAWTEGDPITTWDYVVVSGDAGAMRVTQVRLSNKGDLSGEIPAAIGYLSGLEILNLNGNNLHGMVPGSLGHLSNLTELRLHRNELEGIETGLGGASSLTLLWAHQNHLGGTIPADLGDLDNLEWLRLDSQISGQRPDDGLTGSIPAELADMDSLERLYLHRNKLSGEIPAALGNSTTLTHITLQQNALSGNIPDLSGMTSLVWLGLYDNELDGGIPSNLGALMNLQRLYLHRNNLTGSVPASIGNLTNLTNLWLEHNNLSGALPNELESLTNLERVRISDNAFTGCIPAALANAPSTDAADLGLETCSGS